MKRGLSYPTKLEADEANAKLAADLGYPIAGRDLPGGVHAPPHQTVTARPYDVIECADGTYLVPTDAAIETQIPKTEAAKLVSVAEKLAPPDPKAAVKP